MPARPFALPPECEGPHVFHPHAHMWDVPGRSCNGRFWCVRCLRWFAGGKCARGAARAA